MSTEGCTEGSIEWSIEDLIGFTKPLPPDIAEDLADLPAAPARLAVAAETRKLERLELSNQFPTEEFARLSVALPEADCEMFQPFTEANIGRKERTVMVTGKRKPFLTLPDDEEKLERYVARFREMQEMFRAEGWGADWPAEVS